PRPRPGLSRPLRWERSISVLISVLGDDRAAELVVQADEAHVDVLTDAVGPDETREGHVLVLQEAVVVPDADRPVRREAELEAGTDRATPAGLAGRAEQRARGRAVDVELVADDSRAALHVGEHVVPGVADLTGDQ